MKKITYVFLLFFTLSQIQAQYGPDIRLGLKGGVNMSTVSGDDLEADFLFGYHIGGYAEIEISDQITFVPEMIFSTQGYQSATSTREDITENISISSEFEDVLNLSYLNFPLLARYNINEFFYAEVGPQIGFLMGAKFKSSFAITQQYPGVDDEGESITITDVVQEESELNFRNRFNDIDLGMSLGVGGYLTDHFMFSARYYLGLNEIDNQNMGFSNQVIMASVGYRF